MTSAKDRAVELYNQYISLASTNGREFRKTVMEQLMAETGCSLAAAATHYNSAKKAFPVDGLGRNISVQKKSSTKDATKEIKPDNDCFSVLEITSDNTVGQCQSFLMQGDASETFDEKVMYRPMTHWVMIQGLGPIFGDAFRLDAGEKIIKEHITA